MSRTKRLRRRLWVRRLIEKRRKLLIRALAWASINAAKMGGTMGELRAAMDTLMKSGRKEKGTTVEVGINDGSGNSSPFPDATSVQRSLERAMASLTCAGKDGGKDEVEVKAAPRVKAIAVDVGQGHSLSFDCYWKDGKLHEIKGVKDDGGGNE